MQYPLQGEKDGPRGPGPGLESRIGSGNGRRGERSAPETPRALGNDLSSGGGPLGNQGLCALGLPTPAQAHKEIPLYHKPAGAREQGSEASNEGGGGILWGEEAVEKLLYLVLSNLNERLEGRRLRGFAEALMGSNHVAQTQ